MVERIYKSVVIITCKGINGFLIESDGDTFEGWKQNTELEKFFGEKQRVLLNKE